MSKKATLELISKHTEGKKKAIIFIHGLSGDELNTWTKKGNLSLPDSFSKDQDLGEFDIFSFGYRTGFFLKQYNIEEISRLLVTQMNYRLRGRNAIYLITHSQGGLIARQLILHLLDREMKNDAERIKGIVYLAVPFGGATAGTLMQWGASLIPNILGRWFFSVQVLSLAVFSKELSLLRERWNLIFSNKKLPNLQEKAVIGLKDRTVTSFSARPDHITDIEEVDEDHRSICKFDSNHILYNSIKQFITSPRGDNEETIENEKDKQISKKADEYLSINNYKKALDEYISLAGKAKSKEMQLYIKYQQGICLYYLAEESNSEKERYLTNSAAIFLEAINLAGKDSSYLIFTTLGKVYFELSSIRNAGYFLKKARESQLEALERCDKETSLDEYLDIQNKLAITYLDMADHENISGNVKQALSIFREILKQNKLSDSLAWLIFNNIGRCYEKLANISNKEDAISHLVKAIDFYYKSLKIVSMVNDPEEYILCRNNLGNTYLLLSQLKDGLEEVEKALECFNEVYEISKKNTQSYEYCHVLNNLGLTHFQFFKKNESKNDLMQAIFYYQNSLAHKEISDRPIMHGKTQMNYGNSLLYLAEIENKEENLNAAIKAFEWSIKLSSNPTNYQNQAARSKRSEAFIEKGSFTQDAKYIYQAIDDLVILIKEPETIDLDSNILHHSFFSNLKDAYSSLYDVEKDKTKYIEMLKVGLKIFSKYDYKFGIASLNKLLGIAYHSLYDDADFYDSIKLEYTLNYFQVALTFYKEIQDQYSISVSLYLLAYVYKEIYVQENEIQYWNEAWNNCEQAKKNIKQLLAVEKNKRNSNLMNSINGISNEIKGLFPI